MAATKKAAAAKAAAAEEHGDEPEPEAVDITTVSDAKPVSVASGYVEIERDGQRAVVDAKSVAELAEQGWTPAE